MPQAERSGRVALVAGLSAALIACAFGYLHMVFLDDWPEAALDGVGTMLAYLAAGTAFQFGIPALCLAAFVLGARARRLWTARVGIACATAALLGYTLYVRTCLDWIG